MDNRGLTYFLLVLTSTCIANISLASSEFTMSIFTVTSRSISVRWSKHMGAHSYEITATPNSALGEAVFVSFNEAIILGTVIGLLPATMYTIKVEALDWRGSVLSQTQTQHLTAPEIPSQVHAYSKTSSSITVDWSAVPNANSYILKAKTGNLIIETDVIGETGTLTDLQPFTSYTISVQSSNAGGTSQPSVHVNTRTVLAAPVIKAISPDSHTIEIRWDPIVNAKEYSITIMRIDSVGSKIKKNTSSTQLIFMNLDAGVTYNIIAYALDANGVPGDDSMINQLTRPLPPQLVRASLTSNSSGGLLEAVVSWNPVTGSQNYTASPIEKSRNTVQNCTSASTSCTISPVDCSKKYNITVIAINEAGPSLPANATELTTVPCPPHLIRIREVHIGNLTVSWDQVFLTDYYMTFVKRDDGLEVMCNTTSRSCDFQSECGFTYFITVFAYNKVGQSLAGEVLNYTTAPCCPEDVKAVYVSSDTIEVEWSPVRGAEIYETKAQDESTVVLCNDTSSVCTLSGLNCNTVYNITVYSYSDVRRYNSSCGKREITTGPCTPEILDITKVSPSTITVLWQPNNEYASYTVFASGDIGVWSCNSSEYSCRIDDLPCGSTFSVSVVATTPEGKSLPSYSQPLETAPCCPDSFTVTPITQSMTNVSWSGAVGTSSFTTILKSSKGEAKCHTGETHCLLGCMTCSTNYTVSLNAFSVTGLSSVCIYQGYSSSACCPSGVRLYNLANNALRVYWRATAGSVSYIANVTGSNANFTCSPSPGDTSCDVTGISCGDIYNVIVSPVSMDGSVATFCSRKTFSVSCSMNSGAMVIYRGKRSLSY
eukprot:gi/632940767/ref/XP_007885493.1/ PREDICTED: fibronectin type III domain-containing protein 7-like [Callorhinchus milii]